MFGIGVTRQQDGNLSFVKALVKRIGTQFFGFAARRADVDHIAGAALKPESRGLSGSPLDLASQRDCLKGEIAGACHVHYDCKIWISHSSVGMMY